MGHRTWLCYETPSPKDAVRWLEGLRLWSFANAKAEEDLGVPMASGAILRTRLEPEGRRLRLNVAAGTLTINRANHHGVIADVDIVVEAPSILPTDFGEFVSWNLTFWRNYVEPLFRAK